MNFKKRKKIRRELWHRAKRWDNEEHRWKVCCALCAGELSHRTATIDHKVPKIKGGSDNIENLQLAHQQCNQKKGCQYNDHDFL